MSGWSLGSLAKWCTSAGSFGRWSAATAVLAATVLLAGCGSAAPSVDALFALAESQAASGHCTQAIGTYSKILSARSGNLVALRGRGTCYGQLGEYAQAIADYSEVTRDTASALDFVTLATYEEDAGYTSQGVADLTVASRLAGATDNVAELLNIAGIQLGYAANSDAAITLNRVPRGARLQEWYLLNGRLEGALFNVTAMTNDFSIAIKLTPTSELAPTLVLAANSWWELGYYHTAISLYQRALSSEGSIDRAEVYQQMGYAYDRMGSLGAAIGAYETAVRLGLPQAAQQEAEYSIASDYASLGQVAQARAALAPLLHGSVPAALQAEVKTLEAALRVGT